MLTPTSPSTLLDVCYDIVVQATAVSTRLQNAVLAQSWLMALALLMQAKVEATLSYSVNGSQHIRLVTSTTDARPGSRSSPCPTTSQDGSKEFAFYFRGKEDVHLQKLRARFAAVDCSATAQRCHVPAVRLHERIPQQPKSCLPEGSTAGAGSFCGTSSKFCFATALSAYPAEVPCRLGSQVASCRLAT